ncbi:MAG TPA: hypothetical protein ENF17_00040 [Candidatus Aminicenantes bacterium]|nr:hypothetical protein [Candidatus Aminicenantes bacterium]
MKEAQKQLLEDYDLKTVPLEQRRSWLDLAVVWIGVAVVLSAILRGMMIGLGMGSIPRVLGAYFLGEALLIAMMALMGYLGARTGLTTALLARISFGRKGAWLISLCLGLAFMGWFGIQAGLFAETFQVFLSTSFPLPWLAFGFGLLMMLPAVFGFRGLKALSWLAVPPMIIIFIYAALSLKNSLLPADKLVQLAQNHTPTPYPLTLGGAASIIAGGFIVGAVTAADIFRYARPKLREILAASLLAMLASAGMQLVGSVLAMKTGLYHENLPALIIKPEYAGLGLVGFLAIAFAQWTTNDSNLYSSVLAFNSILKWTRWKLAILLGIISSLLAAGGILSRLGGFLSLLSIGIGPIGGILMADFFFLHRGKWGAWEAVKREEEEEEAEKEVELPEKVDKLEKEEGKEREEEKEKKTEWKQGWEKGEKEKEKGESKPPCQLGIKIRDKFREWNPVALGAYGLGFLVGWLTSGHPWHISVFPFSIYAFNGILSAALAYWLGMKIVGGKLF